MKVQIRRRFALGLIGASFATSLILGSASVGAAATSANEQRDFAANQTVATASTVTISTNALAPSVNIVAMPTEGHDYDGRSCGPQRNEQRYIGYCED